MKTFGNFRINTKPNVQSEGQAEQDNGEQILSPTFQCGFSEMVLLFFFLFVCDFLSLVCPFEVFLSKLSTDNQSIIFYNRFCVRK